MLDDRSPRRLRGRERLLEKRREHEVPQIRRLRVGVLDAVEELSPDDAATSPDRCERAEIEVPAVLAGTGAQMFEALRVGHDLRGIKGVAHVIDQPRVRTCRLRTTRWAGEDGGRLDTFRLLARQHAGENCFCDSGQWNAELERRFARPPSSAFLLR